MKIMFFLTTCTLEGFRGFYNSTSTETQNEQINIKTSQFSHDYNIFRTFKDSASVLRVKAAWLPDLLCTNFAFSLVMVACSSCKETS